jgi:TIR domain
MPGANQHRGMPDIFISYSRQDRDFVEALRARFSELGRKTWVDVNDIPPSAKWRAEVLSNIEQANAFVFVLSPDSIVSLECVRELAHAVKCHKRIIPVLHREVDPEAVPPDLTELNWVTLRPLEAGFETLLHAIDTDPDWVRAHTRLGVRALEWDAKDREPSLLLRGADFRTAERWLSNAAAREPAPTSLQAEYVRASRRAMITRRRVLVSSLASVVTVMGALGFVAYERGRPISDTLKTLTERMDEAKPNQQPIRTVTATIEIVRDAVGSSDYGELKVGVNARDLGCPSQVTLFRGSEALLTLSSPECFIRKERNGELIYRVVVNMDPADSANGQPVSWLAHAESMRVDIDQIPADSRISRGKALLIINSTMRIEISIPPQVASQDTALAAIPKTALADLSK